MLVYVRLRHVASRLVTLRYVTSGLLCFVGFLVWFGMIVFVVVRLG
jgi:hypothetical protein